MPVILLKSGRRSWWCTIWRHDWNAWLRERDGYEWRYCYRCQDAERRP